MADDKKGTPASEHEESGEEAHERRERWGDHEPGGATMTPGGHPAAAETEETDSTSDDSPSTS